MKTLMSIDLRTQKSHRPVRSVCARRRPTESVGLHGTIEPDYEELLVAAITHIDVCDTDTILP